MVRFLKVQLVKFKTFQNLKLKRKNLRKIVTCSVSMQRSTLISGFCFNFSGLEISPAPAQTEHLSLLCFSLNNSSWGIPYLQRRWGHFRGTLRVSTEGKGNTGLQTSHIAPLKIYLSINQFMQKKKRLSFSETRSDPPCASLVTHKKSV